MNLHDMAPSRPYADVPFFTAEVKEALGDATYGRHLAHWHIDGIPYVLWESGDTRERVVALDYEHQLTIRTLENREVDEYNSTWGLWAEHTLTPDGQPVHPEELDPDVEDDYF